MFAKWTVIFAVFISHVLALARLPPKKSLDFSMYDRQFYRVGDTELDDEVTDCAVVEHQFKKGYIRLREYLERKRGCGRRGKMSNIEGIEKSTEDDINNDNIAEIAKSTTEDYDYSPPSYEAPVKQPPQLKTTPQVINTYQAHKMNGVPYLHPSSVTPAMQHSAVHVSVPRNQPSRPTMKDYESHSQDLALSYENNPQSSAMKTDSFEHSRYGNQNRQSYLGGAYINNKNDQYSRLASNNDNYSEQKPQHDLLQTFYPDQIHERSHTQPNVAVGEPLFIKHPETSTHEPLNAQNNPVNKVSALLENAMKNFGQSSVRKPSNENAINAARVKPQIFNRPANKPISINEATRQNENADDVHADMRDPDKDVSDDNSQSVDQEPPPEPGIDDEPADLVNNKPGKLSTGQSLNSLKKPNGHGFVAKGNPMFVRRPQNITKPAEQITDNVNLRQSSINFEILKNKIMHSTNTTFLRRMLTLIQKITHHKDYQKLQGPARSLVAQANTAVQALNKAYGDRSSTSPLSAGIGNQLYVNNFALRKKSAVQTPVSAYNRRIMMPLGNRGSGNIYSNGYALKKKSAVQTPSTAYNTRIMSPGNQGNFYRNVYALRRKSAVQRPIAVYRNTNAMSQGNLRTGRIYDYAQRKSTAVPKPNVVYNNRMAMSSVNPGVVNQFYGNDYTISKKFQIARNPYYQNYYQLRQPYYRNIESLRYGLYNGNTP